ncbi:MAG TPA: hypothetical protein VFH90_07080 [Candidatus Limnocylindria bacterium]|nr:hypothetical protein [Candidatus Limnocylindria bacterium]
MDGGIPPIDPLDLEQQARYRQRDYTEGRSGWLARRSGANLLVLGAFILAAVIVFLLTR